MVIFYSTGMYPQVLGGWGGEIQNILPSTALCMLLSDMPTIARVVRLFNRGSQPLLVLKPVPGKEIYSWYYKHDQSLHLVKPCALGEKLLMLFFLNGLVVNIPSKYLGL